MIQAQQQKYLQNSIKTASPAQLLLMLYDGAIRFCKLGIEAMKQRKLEEANGYIYRVQDIIKEFIVTLDRKSSVAEGLIPLYDYFIRRLIEANVKKSPEPIEEVMGHLVELKEAWMQAAKQALAQKHSTGIRNG